MKQLWIFRHAKTEKLSVQGSDHQRRLLAQGIQSAKIIGKTIASTGILPELVLCSSAERTTATALLALAELPIDLEPESHDELYSADLSTILALLAGRSESRIMVVGHNPCMEDVLAHFSDELCPMRPGTCVRLDFSVSLWEELFGPVRAIKSTFFLAPD